LFKTIIIASIYYFSLLSNISFSQDTSKTKTDTSKIPFTFIISETKYSYLNQVNPDTITRKRFLWHPLKAIDDIFNYLPGYYLRTMDAGQINQLTFNQLDHNNTGVLRNGRPINDMIDGSIDLNLLSRNEIAEIELSNGFGNSIYSYSNTVNIIQRQQFQNRPFTELAFWQDRYANEYVDANFSQNFFKGFNFNFGITKQSYDGKYTNSDFDKWLGRFNFNIAPSKSLNFFLYTNYAKIQRGLNGGIDPDTVDLGNKQTMFNPTLAIVKNSDAYEIKERFDIDAGGIFKKGISFTKLQLYVSNSFRWYRDEENRPNSNGITIKDNIHWINYGAKLQEILNFKIFKKLSVVSRSEAEFNHIINMNDFYSDIYSYSNYYTNEYLNLFENLEFNYNNLCIDGYLKLRIYSRNGIRTYYRYSGIKINYKVQFDTLNSVNFFAMYNTKKHYSNVGLAFINGQNKLSADLCSYKYYTYYLTTGDISNEYDIRGINTETHLNILNFDLDLKYSYIFKNNDLTQIVPQHHGNISIAYHNTGFKNKFEFKIGLVSKFWSKYLSNFYNNINNSFSNYLPISSITTDTISIPANATLDFFIIGKISRATFGLTFENIFDRLIYNMGVYPAIDRGGLFNTLSRFNITWSFFD